MNQLWIEDDVKAAIPACMIVNDPAPFFNCHWVNHKMVCREIPTSFYVEISRWLEKEKIKGKFTVVPCLGGIENLVYDGFPVL